jgi:hypothetical protein
MCLLFCVTVHSMRPARGRVIFFLKQEGSRYEMPKMYRYDGHAIVFQPVSKF